MGGGGFLGGLGQGLSDGGAFIQSRDAAKQIDSFEKERLAKLLGHVKAGEAVQGTAYGKAESALRAQLPVVRKAAQDARANVALTADRRARELREGEKALMARGQNQVYRAGGVGSSAGGLVSRGVRSDTTRAMNQLDELFATTFGQFAQNEAAQTGQIAGGIAQNKQAFAQSAMQLMQEKLAAEAGKQNAVNPHFGGALMSGAGGYLSGGAGGSANLNGAVPGGTAGQQGGGGKGKGKF